MKQQMNISFSEKKFLFKPLVIFWQGMSSLLNPLSDGIGADIIFLSELIGRDVILEHLPHDGLLLGLGHRVRADHWSDKGRLDTSQRYARGREWQHGSIPETPGDKRSMRHTL